MEEHYKIGFALSGGFVRGFAHMGALQALKENGIRPDIISGVSIGSVAGAFIADGKSPYEVMTLFSNKEFKNFSAFTRARGGLMRLDNFQDFLRDSLSVNNIEQLGLPLVVTATNLEKGTSNHFSKGDLATHLAASCCLPGLFVPINIDGNNYVDGGVLMNLPVTTIRSKCDKVVAVNISPLQADADYKMNMAGILYRTYHLMSHSNILHDRRISDMLIEPDGLEVYGNTQLDKGEEIFEIGYKAANKVIGHVKDILFPDAVGTERNM